MYRKINSEIKVEVVKSYWKTDNVSVTSRSFGISRKTIYQWAEIAESRLKEIFEEERLGQKKGISLKEQVKILKEKVSELFLILHKEGGEISQHPCICPKCNSTTIRKNGKVFTKREGLRQRYLCSSCSFSIYIGLKKTP
ncbi:MAG: helix-turn-helix domain-containing protein [bacterium]